MDLMNHFMDFVLGEIEHVLQLTDPRNPNVDLIKVRQVVVAHQSFVVAMKESLLEESKASEPGETLTSRNQTTRQLLRDIEVNKVG